MYKRLFGYWSNNCLPNGQFWPKLMNNFGKFCQKIKSAGCFNWCQCGFHSYTYKKVFRRFFHQFYFLMKWNRIPMWFQSVVRFAIQINILKTQLFYIVIPHSLIWFTHCIYKLEIDRSILLLQTYFHVVLKNNSFPY